MAQGEFALVRENIEKGIGRDKEFAADPDFYAMLVDAAVQQRDQAGLRHYASLFEEIVNPIEHKLYLASAHRAWGVLHRLEGNYKEAERRLREAVGIFRGLDTRWQLGRTYIELGELATVRKNRAAARQHYAQALALFEEIGAVPDAGRVIAVLDGDL